MPCCIWIRTYFLFPPPLYVRRLVYVTVVTKSHIWRLATLLSRICSFWGKFQLLFCIRSLKNLTILSLLVSFKNDFTFFRCPYCYYRNGNESNNRRHIRKHEDLIRQGIDSHWNPYSSLGSIAILKEKLRPLPEVQVLLAKMNNKEILDLSRKRKLASTISQLPDSTT